jgi:hypothetical protein
MMIASLLSKLLALAAALGVIAWVAEKRRSDPNGQVALYVQHPQRLWIAIGLLLLPWLLSMIVWLTIGTTTYSAGSGMPVMIAISAILAVFGGAVLGLSASCLLEPPEPGQPPRLALAMGIAVVIVLLPIWFFISPAFTSAARFVAEVVILALAFHLTRSSTASASTDPGASPSAAAPAGSPAKALLLAFAPAALLLVIITVAATPLAGAFSDNMSRAIFIAASIASLVCCFLSSRMLFSRRTTGAVAGAIALILLNGFVAFAFGCAALLVGASFH